MHACRPYEKNEDGGSLASKNHFRHAPPPPRIDGRIESGVKAAIASSKPRLSLISCFQSKCRPDIIIIIVIEMSFLFYFFDVEAWRVFRLHKTTLVISSMLEYRVCFGQVPLKILHTQSANEKKMVKGVKSCALQIQASIFPSFLIGKQNSIWSGHAVLDRI